MPPPRNRHYGERPGSLPRYRSAAQQDSTFGRSIHSPCSFSPASASKARPLPADAALGGCSRSCYASKDRSSPTGIASSASRTNALGLNPRNSRTIAGKWRVSGFPDFARKSPDRRHVRSGSETRPTWARTASPARPADRRRAAPSIGAIQWQREARFVSSARAHPAAAVGSINSGSLLLTLPTRLSTGQMTMSSAG
jgi:hypothetical protein